MRTITLGLLKKYYWLHLECAKGNINLTGEKENLIRYNTVKEMVLAMDVLTEQEITQHREDVENEFYVF